ncbi:uncharacterized protein H6S33_008707 [Morchella sextelata]|uniref:uncharacterized protein n=1 Tax=Morchella sextelata TaxID=1174677 RepID=UPI001D0376AD|nr:uncharacterized protein H6S33_008707 [Morchella sextelata]KAH0602368.1 hypothetical protein H6S33_008707 [Morchella sextelata]
MASVSLYDCRITISLGEELPAPILDADETHHAARERMYQVLVGDRLNNPEDSTTIGEFKALGTRACTGRGFNEEVAVVKGLRTKMGYTEREELEWPLLRALEEGLQRNWTASTLCSQKLLMRREWGEWVYWLRSE